MKIRFNFRKDRSDPKYIEKQRAKYEKLYEANDKRYIEACAYAIKKGDEEIFADYILDKGAIHDVQEEGFTQTYSPSVKKDIVPKIFDFMSRLEIKSLYNTAGNRLGSKIQGLYETGKLGFMDLYQMSVCDINAQNANMIEELIDLSMNPNYEIGTHATGAMLFGDNINREGVILTGHLSSGVASPTNAKDADLSNNISFHRNLKDGTTNVGLLIRGIIGGGKYKNQAGKIGNVSIVTIPKQDWAGDIIQKRADGMCVVNPKYVFGYAVVDNENRSITDIVHNGKYLANNYNQHINFSNSNTSTRRIEDPDKNTDDLVY